MLVMIASGMAVARRTFQSILMSSTYVAAHESAIWSHALTAQTFRHHPVENLRGRDGKPRDEQGAGRLYETVTERRGTNKRWTDCATVRDSYRNMRHDRTVHYVLTQHSSCAVLTKTCSCVTFARSRALDQLVGASWISAITLSP